MAEVLFICTGNYYRSRYAQALFNHEAEKRGLPWRAFSRGLATWQVPPNSLSPQTQQALKIKRIPQHMAGNGPNPVTREDLETSKKIIALKKEEHYRLMTEQFPDWAEKIDYWTVHDLDCAPMEEAILHIDELVESLLGEVAEHIGRNQS